MTLSTSSSTHQRAIMARRTAIINHWFVSVDTPKQQRPVSARAPSARQTKSFPTENEAKQFAKVMLAEGMKATAGTLSPHKPIRRTITASEIYQWIEEEVDGSQLGGEREKTRHRR
jgi:hypothetical protein